MSKRFALAPPAALLLLLSGRCFAQQPAPPTSPDQTKQDLCTVAGTVVSAGTGEPLKKARITLIAPRDNDGSHALRGTTDLAGHFSIENVASGRYRMEVERVGYLPQEYGQDQPDRAGAMLTLAPGQKMSDLLFRLQPTGVIAGHVRDEDGDPAPNANVEVLRRLYVGGRVRITQVGNSTTNDLGEYRVFGLSPGRYYVRATLNMGEFLLPARPGTSFSQPTMAYAPTYYPGTVDPSRAVIVGVKAGDEIPGIDLSLLTNRTFKIRGRVMNVASKPGSEAVVELVAHDSEVDLNFNIRHARVDTKTGEFEISGITSGSYVLSAYVPEEGQTQSASQEVDISNADVDDVSLILTRGVDVSGRITVEGRSVTPDATAVFLSARWPMFAHSARALPGPDGSFHISDLADGSYLIRVRSRCVDCYVKSVRANGVDVLDQGFQISSGAAPPSIEIVYSSNTGAVSGSVSRDDDLPAAGALVVLVPDPAFRKNFDRYKTASTDQYGAFAISGIAPGNYTVFAWEKIEEGAYEDPEFLKAFEKTGEPLEVEENGKKTLQLKLIPATSEQPQN